MISTAYDSIIAKYSAQFGVPDAWIRAVILTESSGNPAAFRSTSPRDTSYGLMQLTLPTAQGLGYIGAPNGLFDVDTNIQLGTKLLSQLRNRYGDDASAVYSAYNSGSGTNYLTNADVAAHVEHFITNLTSVISNNPLIATSGSIGALAVLAFVWYWTKRKGK